MPTAVFVVSFVISRVEKKRLFKEIAIEESATLEMITFSSLSSCEWIYLYPVLFLVPRTASQ